MKLTPKNYAELLSDIAMKLEKGSKKEEEAKEELKRLVWVICKRHDQKKLTKIIQLFKEIIDQKKGIVKVKLESAFPLSEGVKDLIRKKIMGRLNKKEGQVSLEEVIKPELIGGIRIIIGSDLIEESWANRLCRIRKKIAFE